MNADSHKSEAEILTRDEMGAPILGLIILFALMFYAGLLYIDRNGGNFSPLVYAPYRNLNEVSDAYPKAAGGADLKIGERVYGATCAPCHQASGMGVPGQYPPLAGSEWVNEKNPSRLIRIPQTGLSGAITVKGQEWNLQMPNMGAALSDEETAALLSYIRQSWGNKASAVTVEQVKKVRQEISNHPGAWTADELKAVSAE